MDSSDSLPLSRIDYSLETLPTKNECAAVGSVGGIIALIKYIIKTVLPPKKKTLMNVVFVFLPGARARILRSS